MCADASVFVHAPPSSVEPYLSIPAAAPAAAADLLHVW